MDNVKVQVMQAYMLCYGINNERTQ